MTVEFESDFSQATPFGFGQNRATVEGALNDAGLNGIRYSAWNDNDDWAVIDPGNGETPFLRSRGNVNDDSQKHWTVQVPTRDLYWMRYAFRFDSSGGSGHAADNGFDFGDSNGTAKTWSTGGKMPGMMKGSPGDNTGGQIASNVFSGRQMWRGGNNGGSGGAPREWVTMSAYHYFYQENGQNRGTQQTYFYEQDLSASQVEFGRNGGTSGTGRGQYGDSKAPHLKVDTWYHLMLGYYVPDDDDGWFEAYWIEEGVDTDWQPQLRIDNMRWMQPGNSGMDGWHLSQHWGGNSADWEPDFLTFVDFKDMGLYTTMAEAEAAFGTVGGNTGGGGGPTAFQITDPIQNQQDTTSPLTVSGTGEPSFYELQLTDTTNGELVSPYDQGSITHDSNNDTWQTDSGIVIPQDGSTIEAIARRSS